MAVDIIPADSKAELERFIRMPMRLSAGDRKYVAPLMFERREALSRKINPFFQHADAQFWLARRDGRDVGRISAQIDHLAKTDPAAPAGYFGMIAAEDDPEVFAALFKTAEDWLRQAGIAKLQLLVRRDNAKAGAFYDTIGYDEAPVTVFAKWLDGREPAP